MTRVALVQLDTSDPESPSVRIDRTLELTAQVASGRHPACEGVVPDLVVLPELWATGAFALEEFRGAAQTLDGPLVQALSRIARDHGGWLHGGSFVEVDAGGEYHNTSVVFDPTGALVGVYRKIHLFGFAGGETTVMTAGAEPVVIANTPLGTLGLATCYDLRFPELFRALLDRGATTFLIASGWPDARIPHWELLTRARAVENQAFVVACNETGTHAGVALGGRSVVVDPTGVVLGEASADPQVLVVSLDPGVVGEARARFPVLPDRRL